MAFTLDSVVPWGRSCEEYVRMFALTNEERHSRNILSCADGPASFQAQLAEQGGRVTSLDPLYAFPAVAICKRIEETRDTVIAQARANADAYIWDTIPSVEALEHARMGAMHAFLDDYAGTRRQRRYIAGMLPDLPFCAKSFDLALCSHFLFTYSEHLSFALHVDSIREMLRVADEARIFPLLDLSGNPSPHLDLVVDALKRENYSVGIRTVDYEFQRGGNRLLVVRTRTA